jgi:sigma-B regulation protein RsbU (phosphoserine phosphatase)
MHRLNCSEVWGGIKNTDLDACSAGMTVSLFSSACEGGKGGDVYYFTVCGQDMLTRLVLADVVGHGQQVSQISQWVYDQLADRMDDPDQPALLSDLNNLVVDRGFGAMTTAVVLSYYLENRHVYYCYAGHPAMLSRNGGAGWHEMTLPAGTRPTNLPLGVEAGMAYDMGDAAFAKGDRLFLFSDGLVEAPNESGDHFGPARLRNALAEAGDAEPMALKNQVLSRLRQWTNGLLDHDDVTLIAIQLQ